MRVARLRIFDFARELRAAHPNANPESLHGPVADWHRSEGHTSDVETTWLEFLEAWATVRCPAGVDAVDAAMQLVDAGDLPAEAKGHTPSLARLISLCRQLRSGPRGLFFLSSRDAGLALLPCDKRTEVAREANVSHGWRAMRHLESLGIVECLHRGTRGYGKAARYRFIGETE